MCRAKVWLIKPLFVIFNHLCLNIIKSIYIIKTCNQLGDFYSKDGYSEALLAKKYSPVPEKKQGRAFPPW